jgi:hypothetical protein
MKSMVCGKLMKWRGRGGYSQLGLALAADRFVVNRCWRGHASGGRMSLCITARTVQAPCNHGISKLTSVPASPGSATVSDLVVFSWSTESGSNRPQKPLKLGDRQCV